MSREGLLERLFALAFGGLVYPQIWEDPDVDRAALQIDDGCHIVAIASGGCNVLSYLIDWPARISAIDLNRSHVALTRLKLAAATHLPAFDDFYRFFGRADDRANLEAYRRHLRPKLDPATRTFWDSRTLSGRRRITRFSRNFYRYGLLGRFITLAHAVSRAYGVDPATLLEGRSLQEQRALFDAHIAGLFDKKFVRWATGKKVSLYGLGIPPAQYRALAGDGDMAEVLRERLRKLACDFPLSENYFAWQAFARRYGPEADCTPPPYLQEANFAALRETAARAEAHNASLTDFLARQPQASADRFVLLDSQDWMTDAQLNALWHEMTRTAKPGARVIFRTAAAPSPLPGRLADGLLGEWAYRAEESHALGLQDRSSIYGGFHLYTLEG